MSIATKLKEVVTLDADDLAVSRLTEKIDTTRSGQGKVFIKWEATNKAVVAKRRELNDAALDAEISGNDTKYKRLEADLVLLERDAERLAGAQSAANDRIVELERELHALGKASHVKTIKRLTNERTKAVTDMLAGLHAFATGFAKVQEKNDRIVRSWPVNGGIGPAGHDLYDNEIKRAVATELLRLNPECPGAAESTFVNVSKLIPLAELMEQHNASLVAKVEKGP